MSEHIVALALAAAKRLFIEHANLKRGEFNQRSANRMLRGGVCGILGFGNVGVATARLMRAFGMKIHANQPPRRERRADRLDRDADLLDEMLRVADVLVISAALTTATEGLIGARELDLMKENAGALHASCRPSALFRRHRCVVGGAGAGTAASRWVIRFSTSRTSSARRTIRRGAGHGVTSTSGALCRIAGAPSSARRRGT
jgi:hypothetical protein